MRSIILLILLNAFSISTYASTNTLTTRVYRIPITIESEEGKSTIINTGGQDQYILDPKTGKVERVPDGGLMPDMPDVKVSDEDRDIIKEALEQLKAEWENKVQAEYEKWEKMSALEPIPERFSAETTGYKRFSVPEQEKKVVQEMQEKEKMAKKDNKTLIDGDVLVMFYGALLYNQDMVVYLCSSVRKEGLMLNEYIDKQGGNKRSKIALAKKMISEKVTIFYEDEAKK